MYRQTKLSKYKSVQQNRPLKDIVFDSLTERVLTIHLCTMNRTLKYKHTWIRVVE